jgi:hypothetical protein
MSDDKRMNMLNGIYEFIIHIDNYEETKPLKHLAFVEVLIGLEHRVIPPHFEYLLFSDNLAFIDYMLIFVYQPKQLKVSRIIEHYVQYGAKYNEHIKLMIKRELFLPAVSVNLFLHLCKYTDLGVDAKEYRDFGGRSFLDCTLHCGDIETINKLMALDIDPFEKEGRSETFVDRVNNLPNILLRDIMKEYILTWTEGFSYVKSS